VRTVAVPAIKRRTDTGQQVLCIEGLIEKADRSGAQCPLTNPVVGKCGTLLLRSASAPKYKAAFATAYGAGLRVSEVVALKVGDVDSERMLLRVECGKGRKHRRQPAQGDRPRRHCGDDADGNLAALPLRRPQPGDPNPRDVVGRWLDDGVSESLNGAFCTLCSPSVGCSIGRYISRWRS
jgi:integrase